MKQSIIYILSILLFSNYLISCQTNTSNTAIELPPIAQTLQNFDLTEAKKANKSNWIQTPYKYWTFKHTNKVFDTAVIAKGDSITVLASSPVDLSNVTVTQQNGNVLNLEQHFFANRTDAIVVLKNGKLVYERYLNNMKPNSSHIWFSMSKSLIAVTLGILVDEGVVDLQQQILFYLPELTGGAWDGTTVQQVMNMTNSLYYSEDYHDLDSDLYQFANIAGFAHYPNNPPKYDSVIEYFKNTKTEGKHDQYFHYVSLNTEVLGMIISKVTGKPVNQVISEKVWSKLGAESDAYIIQGNDGFQLASGGVNTTTRDAARFGQMMLEDGYYNNQRIISTAFVESVEAGGSKALFAPSLRGQQFKDFSYINQWWHTDKNEYFAKGLFGQWLFVDPDNNMVVALYTTTDTPNSAKGTDWQNGLNLMRALSTTLSKALK